MRPLADHLVPRDKYRSNFETLFVKYAPWSQIYVMKQQLSQWVITKYDKEFSMFHVNDIRNCLMSFEEKINLMVAQKKE